MDVDAAHRGVHAGLPQQVHRLRNGLGWQMDELVVVEGDIGVAPLKPYSIAYGSIIPKENECANLLVPVCMSSTHIAYGSIRMEPVFMILGQSAATAAVRLMPRMLMIVRTAIAPIGSHTLLPSQTYS